MGEIVTNAVISVFIFLETRSQNQIISYIIFIEKLYNILTSGDRIQDDNNVQLYRWNSWKKLHFFQEFWKNWYNRCYYCIVVNTKENSSDLGIILGHWNQENVRNRGKMWYFRQICIFDFQFLKWCFCVLGTNFLSKWKIRTYSWC